MGIILAILFVSGKIPSVNEELQISLNGNEIWLVANFTSLIGILHDPDDLESSSEFIMEVTSYGLNVQLYFVGKSVDFSY